MSSPPSVAPATARIAAPMPPSTFTSCRAAPAPPNTSAASSPLLLSPRPVARPLQRPSHTCLALPLRCSLRAPPLRARARARRAATALVCAPASRLFRSAARAVTPMRRSRPARRPPLLTAPRGLVATAPPYCPASSPTGHCRASGHFRRPCPVGLRQGRAPARPCALASQTTGPAPL
nr:microtubule-associated protein homolog maph-1.1-like [Aegilops tauschii subsp. strangulata]